MQLFARVPTIPGPVAELVSLPDGVKLTDAFAAAVAATMYPCGTSIGEGYAFDGKTFTAPAVAPLSPAQLADAAQGKQLGLRDGGISVNIGTSSAPQEVDVASDVDGRSLVSGCIQLIGLASQNSQPAPSFPWINNDGTQVTLTAAQMMTIGYALGAFVQATYATLGTVLAAIANGTITTEAGVNSAAWPAPSL